jgi:nucleoside-diphosphate-sugar epimerase
VTAKARVLVTGGRGFIGRECLAPLAAAGFEIVAVTRARGPAAVPAVIWETADLLAPGVAQTLVERHRPTHLLHLAWYTKSPDYWNAACNDDWARCSIELCRAFIATGGRRIVAAGTCAEYAWLGERCREASTPLRPATYYGSMKLRALTAIAALARDANVPCAWARPFFAYGPGEEPGKLLSSTARKLRAGEPVALSQPQRRLDFVHVDDIAEALVALVDCAADGPRNVGTGNGVSILEAVEALGAALGVSPRIEYADGPQERDVVADTGRLSEVLAWQPRSIVAGVQSLIEGYVQ